MIFNKPIKFDGEIFKKQLLEINVVCNDDMQFIDDGEGNLIINLDEKYKEKISALLNSHSDLVIEKDNDKISKKTALLSKLGITEEEMSILLS